MTRDRTTAALALAVAVAVTFATGSILFAAAVWAAATVMCVWMLIGLTGQHAVYYLRSDADDTTPGAVLYVGITSPRGGGGGPDFAERLAEHLDDAEARPFKARVDVAASTVVRRCWTRRGARISEARRIAAINRAAKRGAVPALHNAQHADRHVGWLTVAWYRAESLIDGAMTSRVGAGATCAVWHRPVVGVPSAAAGSADDELDLLAAAACQRQLARRQATPAAPVVSDEQVEATIARWEAAWPSASGDDGLDGDVDVERDAPSRGAAGGDPYGSLGGVTRDSVTRDSVTAPVGPVGDDQQTPPPHHNPENSDRRPSGLSSAPTGAGEGDEGRADGPGGRDAETADERRKRLAADRQRRRRDRQRDAGRDADGGLDDAA